MYYEMHVGYVWFRLQPTEQRRKAREIRYTHESQESEEEEEELVHDTVSGR